MKVSRKSWHYKIWKIITSNDHEPKTLCKYFGTIVFLGPLVTIVVVVTFPLWVPFLTFLFIADWVENQRKKEDPILVVSYYRALKNKVCPIIEFED